MKFILYTKAFECFERRKKKKIVVECKRKKNHFTPREHVIQTELDKSYHIL